MVLLFHEPWNPSSGLFLYEIVWARSRGYSVTHLMIDACLSPSAMDAPPPFRVVKVTSLSRLYYTSEVDGCQDNKHYNSINNYDADTLCYVYSKSTKND